MKITKTQLRQIIKEEYERIVAEVEGKEEGTEKAIYFYKEPGSGMRGPVTKAELENIKKRAPDVKVIPARIDSDGNPIRPFGR